MNRLHQHKHKFEDKAISKFLIVCQEFGRQTLKGHGHNPSQPNTTKSDIRGNDQTNSYITKRTRNPSNLRVGF